MAPKESTSMVAEYACDKCRIRKVSCSRGLPYCQRCIEEHSDCIYSRRGIIRRNRKRKVVAGNVSKAPLLASTASDELLSHLTADIDAVREGLQPLPNRDEPLSALRSLSEASGSIWLECADAADLDKEAMSKKYFLFEGRAEEFANVFISSLEKGHPMLFLPSAQILGSLRDQRPDQVEERAWLVMYYSIVLSFVSSVSPEDSLTKRKLQRNLWLAFNDVRILLEPSEANIQALFILAIHVEDFTSPSLCWMLTSTACRMLQALGVNQRRLDMQTRDRRRMMFWNLNQLDKGLAMIFGRPPTNHRAMANEIPMPSLEQLLPFRPHISNSLSPALFGAHFLHQMMLLSRLMGDVWAYLNEDPNGDVEHIQTTLGQLEQWYQQASKVLNAAAITERPFLGTEAAASIDIGLWMPTFQYHYITVLLLRSETHMQSRRLASSRALLNTLPHLVSDSQEVFNGMVWQLICCPFSAFLVLFGEITNSRMIDPTAKNESLNAMEQLPAFLCQMAQRHTLAAKLERVAAVLTEHAKAYATRRPSVAELSSELDTSFEGEFSIQEYTGDTVTAAEFSDLGMWIDSVLGEPFIDWLGLDGMMQPS